MYVLCLKLNRAHIQHISEVNTTTSYITKEQITATSFRLKMPSSDKAKDHEVLYNMAVFIWDPRWLTMCAVIRTMYII